MLKLKYNSPGLLNINQYKKTLEIFNTNLDDLTKNVKILAIYCDVEEKEIMKLRPDQVTILIEQMSNNIKNYKTDYSKRLKSLVINGNKYSINYNIQKINIAQYIDYQITIAENDYINNLASLLSIFVIPAGKKYNEDYDVDEVISLIENNITMDIALSIVFFSAKRSMSIIRARIIFCKAMLKVMSWTMKKEQKQALMTALKQLETLENYLINIYH